MIGVMIDYSEAFTDCIHFRKNREEYHALHEHSDIVGGALVRQQTRLRLVYICAGDFADKNNGAITALATVMVGLFTFTLWHTTRGLRRLGEGQAEDMRDLLKAARDNADAATGLRAAAEAQERALSAQAKATVAIAEMAEKAVVELEAPYVYVKITDPGFTLGSEIQTIDEIIDEPIGVREHPVPRHFTKIGELKYCLGNYGRTLAIVTEIFAEVMPPTTLLPAPATNFGGSKMPHGVIAPAQGVLDREYVVEEMNKFLVDANDRPRYLPGQNNLYFWGFVRYKDLFDRNYITGFCFMYHPLDGQFVLAGGDVYNYRRREKDTEHQSTEPSTSA